MKLEEENCIHFQLVQKCTVQCFTLCIKLSALPPKYFSKQNTLAYFGKRFNIILYRTSRRQAFCPNRQSSNAVAAAEADEAAAAVAVAGDAGVGSIKLAFSLLVTVAASNQGITDMRCGIQVSGGLAPSSQTVGSNRRIQEPLVCRPVVCF